MKRALHIVKDVTVNAREKTCGRCVYLDRTYTRFSEQGVFRHCGLFDVLVHVESATKRSTECLAAEEAAR